MKTLITQFILCGAVVFGSTNIFAQESEATILKLSNPAQSNGIHIGDLLSREIELEVQSPYQISKSAFPIKGSSQNGIELVDVKVASSQVDQKTHYKLELTYQVFASMTAPTVMALPTESLVLTGGAKALSLNMPIWRFWFSPLVVANVESAKVNIQPQLKTPLVNINNDQSRLMTFLGLFVIGLLGLVYVNADKRWLPLMGGAFAQAHRKLKALAKAKTTITHSEAKKALLYMHQAFNKVYGSNFFAQDIDSFLATNPKFVNLKIEILAFFEKSNQSLFAKQHQHDGFIQELVILSKKLRDCERGV